MMRVASPVLFAPVEFDYEDLGGRRVRVVTRLRAGARPCEAWFRGSAGALRGVPRHLNHPPAIVEAQIARDHAVYDIELPEARTLGRRVRGTVNVAIDLVFGIDRDGTPVGGRLGEIAPDSFGHRIESAIATWKLTPRQGEVLSRLARGQSNKDIARELGCAENTVELHVTQLLRKTNVTSRTQLIARLWAET